MYEHVFDPPPDPLTDDAATAYAAEQAEQLIEEIGRHEHDWLLICRLAEAVAHVAHSMSHL